MNIIHTTLMMAMEVKFSSSISKNVAVMRMMNSLQLLLLNMILILMCAATSEAGRAVTVSLSHRHHHDDASAAAAAAGMALLPVLRRGLASDSMVSISISYDDGETRVQDGQMLSVSETATHPPSFYISSNGGGEGEGDYYYSVAMIDRMASREEAGAGAPLQTFVHYWVMVRSRGPQVAAAVEEVLAPYVRPAPHDSLLHPYEVLLFAASPSTTSPPPSFRLSDRYVQDFESLVQGQPPLASTRFTEQITSP